MANDALNPIDTWLTVRREWVKHLKASVVVTNRVSAANIFGEAVPSGVTWPFIRIGVQISEPWTATGLRGGSHRLTTHSFFKHEYSDGVSEIAAAVVEAMDTFVIPSLDIMNLQWVGTTTIQDSDEKNGWHAITDMDVVAVLSAA